jgi:peptidoglycan hydrolase CwlO-like protein
MGRPPLLNRLGACTEKGFSIMLKKLVIAAAAIVVGLGIIRFTKPGKELGGLVKLWWHQSGDWAKNQITLETRIDQLALEVDQMSGEIRTLRDKKADLKADYLLLKEDIDKKEEAQAARKAKLETQVSLVEKSSGEDRRAQQLLENLTAEVTIAEQTLKAKNNLLKTKAKRLEDAERILQKRLQEQLELTNEVEQMRAQVETIRDQAESTNTCCDESQANRRETLKQDVRRMMLKLQDLSEKKPVKEERSKADSLKAARAVLQGGEVRVAGEPDVR